MASKHSISLFFVLYLLWLTKALVIECFAARVPSSTQGSSDPKDWVNFDPRYYSHAELLVPSPRLGLDDWRSFLYGHGNPAFPHDPTKNNIIYGRGLESLPTEIYAKSFDILEIRRKYFQAPAAGERKQLVIEGQSVTLFGTSFYTPLPDNKFVGNPVQIVPFNPSRIFYRDNETWPSIIYGEVGTEISIAGQHIRVPGPGQSKILIFSADGKLKTSALASTDDIAAVVRQSRQDKSSENRRNQEVRHPPCQEKSVLQCRARQLVQ